MTVDVPPGLVDAHHHIWLPVGGPPDIGYGWLRDIGAPKPFGDPTAIQRDYLLAEFLAEPQETLAASVHVQADGALPDPVAETAWVSDVCAAADHPVAIVGLVDLASDNAEAILDGHQRFTAFRGVRQIVARLPERPDLSFAGTDLLADPRWRDRLGLLADRGLTFDLQLYPEQMPAAAEVFAKHPALTVVLDHAGSPRDQSAAGLRRWRDGIDRLAALPQLCVKLSGWGMFDPGWSGDSVRPLVDHLLDRVGPDRVMFGSNYPVEKLAASYPAMLAALRGIVPADMQRAVFRDTALAVYRPAVPQPSA